MKMIAALILALTLPACSAVYQLERTNAATGDTCKISIYSRRDVTGPNSLKVGKDCTVTAGVGNLTGGQITPLESALVQALISGILRVPVPEPEK